MYDVLEGVRVVEVAAWVLVPSAGAILSDLGATVIKVEHPITGEPNRGLRSSDFGTSDNKVVDINPMMEIPNRGKQSIGLDISTPAGHEILMKLVAEADVFTTSFLDPVREKLGITFDDLRKVNPRIVYARGSGFGPLGDERDRPGFDVVSTWARAGFAARLMRSGLFKEPPMMPGSVGDLSGGLALAGAISAALFKRERTGEAQQVDVSLLQVGTWILSQSITGAPLGLGVQGDTDSRTDMANPLTNSYPTADGRWLWLCFLQPDKWWPDLCEHLERKDLIDDPRFATMDVRHENRVACIEELDRVFRTRTLAEWKERFKTLVGVWGPVQTPLEVSEDPQAIANGYVTMADRGDGTTFKIVAAPMTFNERPVGTLHAGPEHGQHTEQILLDLGYSWDDIGPLKDQGAIN